MSQLTSSTFAGEAPSGPILTLTGDTNVGGGGPTPVGPDGTGTININGDGVFIQVQDNAAGNQIKIIQLNSGQGVATTIGAVSATVFSFPLGATPAVYEIEVRIVGFNASTPAGYGSKVFATVRTTGAAGVLIGVNDDALSNEVALENANAVVAVNVSSANSFDIVATGVVGLTIHWKATAQFTFVT